MQERLLSINKLQILNAWKIMLTTKLVKLKVNCPEIENNVG